MQDLFYLLHCKVYGFRMIPSSSRLRNSAWSMIFYFLTNFCKAVYRVCLHRTSGFFSHKPLEFQVASKLFLCWFTLAWWIHFLAY